MLIVDVFKSTWNHRQKDVECLMSGESWLDCVGNIGSITSALISIGESFVKHKTHKRLALLEKELRNHVDCTKHLTLSDDEYNLLLYIIRSSAYNGTEQRIKRFARIAKDVMYYGNIDISRGEKFVYTINHLSDQEVAFLMRIYSEKSDDISITLPTPNGDYQNFVKDAFNDIGISKVEWLVVLKKFDTLGILQFKASFLKGGMSYALSEYGEKFIRYLLAKGDEIDM